MSFAAPNPVVSGQRYSVISVNDTVPSTLEQFIGEASFAILDRGAGPARISGQGSAHSDGVRFQEKDVDNAGKDIRVWTIAEVDGDFEATAVAAF